MSKSARELHDELLAIKPAGATHEAASCDFCSQSQQSMQMEAAVADEATFTQAQLDALVRAEVEKATANLTAEVSSLKDEKAQLNTRIDVLESEKAAAVGKAEAAEKAFEDFKAESAEKAAAAERLETRVSEVREVATHLPEAYFTEERKARWAGMADAEFASLKADLAEAAESAPKVDPNLPPRETAAAGATTTAKQPEGSSAMSRWVTGQHFTKEA